MRFFKNITFLFACFILFGCTSCNSSTQKPDNAIPGSITGEKFDYIKIPEIEYVIAKATEKKSNDSRNPRIPGLDISEQNTNISTDTVSEDLKANCIIQEDDFKQSELPVPEKISVEPVPIHFLGNEQEILEQKCILSRNNHYWLSTRDFVENVLECTDIDNYDYLLRTHEIYYTREYLENCPDVVLKLAKNEIYARHGRMFADPDLYEYFLTRMWYEPVYTPEEFDDSCFNDCERANLDLLLKLGA